MALNIDAQFEKLRLMLELDGGKSTSAALRVLDEKADELVAEMVNNAPADQLNINRKQHNLEASIRRTPNRRLSATQTMNRQSRAADGRFLKYKIVIDVADEATGADGKTVQMHPYADIMEESDRYNPNREGNKQKAAAGGKPGRKYMERAYDAIDPTVVPKIIKEIKRVL